MTYRAFEHFQSLERHSSNVISLAITADKQTLVSGGGDGTIKIWYLPAGELQRTLESHRDSITRIVISKDGQMLVSGSMDRTIKIWHLPTGRLQQTLDAKDMDWVHCVALSPDERYVFGGDKAGIIRVWDLVTEKLEQTWTAYDQRSWSYSIRELVFTADGKTLISCSFDKTIRVWEMPAGRLVRTLTGHTDVITSIALSSDEQILISGSWDESVRIWDWKTGEQKQRLGGYAGKVPMGLIHPTYGTTPSRPTVRCIAISSDGETIFSGDELRQITIWDRTSGKIQQVLSQSASPVLGLLLIDENTFATGGRRNVDIWRRS
jgi:WD40 repeat protein